MTTILPLFPDIKDATCFYRGIGPLKQLARDYSIRLQLGSTSIAWYDLKSADILFYQRPFHIEHLKIIEYAKKLGRKVWIDYDDNLFCLHPSNTQYQMYSDPTTTAQIVKCLTAADIVTVTTEALAQEYRAVIPENKEKVRVLPNAYDEDLMPDLTKPRRERKNTVVWRGGTSHQADLWTFAEDIYSAVIAHPDTQFKFIGNPFWLAMKNMAAPNVSSSGPIDIIDYFAWLTNEAPKLLFVPLEDTKFNRCKSNIAWLEATGAGAICLAPDWPEWNHGGVSAYDPDSFIECFADTLREDTQDDWELAREVILSSLTLKEVNLARIEICRELTQS